MTHHQGAQINHECLHLPKESVLTQLGWPQLPYDLYLTPRQPEIRTARLLLWLSTTFPHAAAMRHWLSDRGNLNPSPKWDALIDILLPQPPKEDFYSKENTPPEIMPLLIFDTLERNLLWYNPEPCSPPECAYLLDQARRIYFENDHDHDWKSPEHNQVYDPEEFGWIRHRPQVADLIYVYTATLHLCVRAQSQPVSDQEWQNLWERVIAANQTAIGHGLDDVFGPDEDLKREQLEARVLEKEQHRRNLMIQILKTKDHQAGSKLLMSGLKLKVAIPSQPFHPTKDHGSIPEDKHPIPRR